MDDFLLGAPREGVSARLSICIGAVDKTSYRLEFGILERARMLAPIDAMDGDCGWTMAEEGLIR
jgi:hypothetical protein